MTPPSDHTGTMDVGTDRLTAIPPPQTLPQYKDIAASLERFRRFSSVSDILRKNEHILKQRTKTTRRVPQRGWGTAVFSVCIIVFVATVTCSIAGLIAYAGISDRHSNIRIAAGFVREWTTPRQSMAATTLPLDATEDIPVSTDNCATGAIDPTVVSIVDFLKSRNIPSTLEERAVLADNYHVLDYHGAAEQNRHLLGILQQDLAGDCNNETTGNVLN